MPPLPTPVSAFAPPPFLLPTITLSLSFPHGLTSRSVQPFATQHISFFLHRRPSNKCPKPHPLSAILFITLRSLLDSFLHLLLPNRCLIRITPNCRPIAKRFTESTFFGLFDPSYFLFAGFRGRKCSGGRVSFCVPIKVSVLLPTADSWAALAAGNKRGPGRGRRTSHKTMTEVVLSVL